MSKTPFRLLREKGEGRPPVDVLGLVAVLAGFAALSFLFAALSQFTGPVVEDGINPQTVAIFQWGGAGIVLGVLAILVYQLRPVGWYGTLVVALVGMIQTVRIDLTFGPVLIVYLTVPLVVITLLLLRRDRFLDR